VRGWTKAVVLALAVAVGIAVFVYAQEITCFDDRYRHLCT
jgi:hypothetical protein